MAVTIKAALLQRNFSYFGGQSTLPYDAFQVPQITTYQHGWIAPFVE